MDGNVEKNILINAIEQKDYNEIIAIIRETVDINAPNYNGKTILKLLVENIIDNEEIYNLLYEKEAFYGENIIKRFKCLEKNIGLMKSFAKYGFYYFNPCNNSSTSVYINKPVLFFTKRGDNYIGVIKNLLDNNACIEEYDENTGFTPIFQAIKYRSYKTFILLINDYHPDITKRNKRNENILMFANKYKKRIKNEMIQCITNIKKRIKEI